MKKFLSILTVLLFVFAFSANLTKAAAPAVELATGGALVSSTGCLGTLSYTTLTGPSLIEAAAGDITTGTIVLTAPAGFTFNTTSTVTAVVTGLATKLTLSSYTATPTASTITFTVATASITKPSTVTFTNVQVQPTTCTVATSGNLTFSGGSGATGSAGSLTVTPGALAKFTVANMTDPVVAGVADESVNVTAQDINGNTITGYTGTVHFSSNDAQAVLPDNHAFEGGDSGTHVFAITLKTVGEKSITVSDVATPAITGSQTAVTVTVAAKNKLAFTSVTPGNSYTYSNLVVQPTVAEEDAFGNITADTDEITIKAYTDSGCTAAATADLTGTLAVNAVAGTATFSAIKYNTVYPAGIYIKASGGGLTTACSSIYKVYANSSQIITTSSSTVATTTTTTPTTTVTTTPAVTTTTAPAFQGKMPVASKAISAMTLTEKNSYIMELQTFLIQLLTQLLTLMKK